MSTPQTKRTVNDRTRRRLVASLRRAAKATCSSAGQGHRQILMLPDRLDAVRANLMMLAALLDQTGDPDAEAVRLLEKLLTDGCESPLYNRAVHVSELTATLFSATKRLSRRTPAQDKAPLTGQW
jgi:hypothetical protein